MQQAEHCLTVGATLGEGPIWVDDALWFVDIKQQRIYRHDPVAGTLDHWASPEMVGWVVPAQRGGFVAGLKSGPHHFDPATGSFEQLAEIDAHLPANRLNDACVDGQGRIWFGTMDNDETSLSGRLFQWSAGRVTPTAADPVCITNGPAISPDDSILYGSFRIGATAEESPLTLSNTNNRLANLISTKAGSLRIDMAGFLTALGLNPEAILQTYLSDSVLTVEAVISDVVIARGSDTSPQKLADLSISVARDAGQVALNILGAGLRGTVTAGR